MTTLVTGAAGFLGGHVTELLLARGHRPRVLIAPGDRADWLAEGGVEIHVADICDPVALRPALSGAEVVIHCAARTGPWGPAREYLRTNVHGLATLLSGALDAGVRRVVHVSSVTVHGNDVQGEADESAPLREEPNPYSRSKVAGEQLLRQMIRDEHAPVAIVRPGWIYGPRDGASFARLAQTIESGRMVLVGAGQNHLPLIYARDAALGAILAAEAPGADGRCYLLVNDEPVTQRDFIAEIATQLGVQPPARSIPYELALKLGTVAERMARLAGGRRPPPVMRYGMQLLGGENQFTISRARGELGFSPQVGLAEGVRRSVEWYRAAQLRMVGV